MRLCCCPSKTSPYIIIQASVWWIHPLMCAKSVPYSGPSSYQELCGADLWSYIIQFDNQFGILYSFSLWPCLDGYNPSYIRTGVCIYAYAIWLTQWLSLCSASSFDDRSANFDPSFRQLPKLLDIVHWSQQCLGDHLGCSYLHINNGDVLLLNKGAIVKTKGLSKSFQLFVVLILGPQVFAP